MSRKTAIWVNCIGGVIFLLVARKVLLLIGAIASPNDAPIEQSV